jgi:hypothetical protein
MGGTCSTHYISVGEAEGKRQLRKPGRKWENIKIDFREIRCEAVYWIHVVQETVHWWALINTVMKLRVPQKAGKSVLSFQ